MNRLCKNLAAVAVLAAAVAVCSPVGWELPVSADTQVPKAPDGPAVQYQFQVIHSFGGPGDGDGAAGLVMDSKGNLYGSSAGGDNPNCMIAEGCGTVFELSPSGNGQWTETILYNFAGGTSDGWDPLGRPVVDEAGNVYGTTVFGGDGQYCLGNVTCGTVYEVSPGANGVWTESIIWNFCSLPDCADGGDPLNGPTLGPGGSLYGVASNVAFQLTPGSGGWTLNPLYTFCKGSGCNPSGYLTFEGGNLYGEGGIGHGVGDCLAQYGCGVVFELQPQPDGQWNEVLLWEFEQYSNKDGGGPAGGLTFHDGGLYGDTEGGGTNCINIGGCGTVFELTQGSGNSINEQILWNFGGHGGAQGFNPGKSWVVFNKQGDLFGVTELGADEFCANGCGVLYGMRPLKNGTWEYDVLHQFNGVDGGQPLGGLTIDSKGDLFGTTPGGGQYGYGVAFEISPTAQAAK